MDEHDDVSLPCREILDMDRLPIPAQVEDFDSEVDAACYSISRVFFLIGKIHSALDMAVLTAKEESDYLDALNRFDGLIATVADTLGHRESEAKHGF